MNTVLGLLKTSAVPALLLVTACTVPQQTADLETLELEVRTTEQAFARSMADRDLEAFASFLSQGAIFFTGDEPLRGKSRVVAVWSRYFDGPEAPFSWEPDDVEVLSDGTLALSTGPVRDEDGNRIATFSSVWRREEDGRWRIVFDRGCTECAGPESE